MVGSRSAHLPIFLDLVDTAQKTIASENFDQDAIEITGSILSSVLIYKIKQEEVDLEYEFLKHKYETLEYSASLCPAIIVAGKYWHIVHLSQKTG